MLILSGPAAACNDVPRDAEGTDAGQAIHRTLSIDSDSMRAIVYRVPLEQIYGRQWQSKRTSYDIHYLDGRVYVGHGSTNSPVGTRVVYFDTVTKTFEVERDTRGREVELPEEIIDRFRHFDGALYVNSRDPVRNGTHFIRRSLDGAWTARVVGPPAHNYDVYRHAGHYLISHPSHRNDFPGILVSTDGRRFEALDGSGLHTGPYTPYFEFIEVGRSLYATTTGSRVTTIDGVRVTSDQPWMVRFEVEDEMSIMPFAQDPGDLVGGLVDEPMAPAQLRRAVTLADATYALNGSAQIVRLSEGPAGDLHAEIIDVPLEAGSYIADLAADESRLLAMLVRPIGDGNARMTIREVGEGGREVHSSVVPGLPTALEAGSDALYVGGHDGLLIEIGD